MASLQSNSFLSYVRAKNHLNIVLQAELYLRTGTYDRPKNTPAIDSACAPLDSALAIDAPGAVEPLVINGLAIDRYYCAGKSLLTHFLMKHH